MPGKAADWEPVEEDLVNSVRRALNASMADFDIPAAVAALSSQCIRAMSRRLFIGHPIVYHI
jgi:hypothetical protein